MKFLQNKTVLILIGFIFFVLGFIFVKHYPNKNKTYDYLVELTDEGFNPEELVIHKGERVKFISKRGKYFQPASDPHPQHTDYPDFDSKKALSPKEGWIFKFEKIGVWYYHDHLGSHYESIDKGVIKVVENGQNTNESQIYPVNCESLTSDEQIYCFQRRLKKILIEQGIEKAFDTLEKLYNSQPKIAQSCHALTHPLGVIAYRQFAQNKALKVSPKTIYCNYGFYHGFMAALMHESGDINQAKEFCFSVEKQLKTVKSNVTSGCYHGIGHGFIDIHDPSVWNNPKSIIDPAISKCHQLSDSTNLNSCLSGAFNAIAISYHDGPYQQADKKEIPFWICDGIGNIEDKKVCYGNMTTVVNWGGRADFEETVKMIAKIQDKELAIAALKTVVQIVSYIKVKNDNFDNEIGVCQHLTLELKNVCLTSFVQGLIDQGPPTEEYKIAHLFCISNKLSGIEKGVCLQGLFDYLKQMYSKDKLYEVCSNFDESEKKLCQG